jgi:Ca-activated chloride channel family protein
VTVVAPHEAERAPYPRERVVDGEMIKVDAEGLAWLRRDGGATLLVHGPAALTVRDDAGPIPGRTVRLSAPGFALESRTDARGQAVFHSLPPGAYRAELLPVPPDAAVSCVLDVLVAIGSRPGLELSCGASTPVRPRSSSALTWDAGPVGSPPRIAAEPSPYGVGTVGARCPGDQGAPRFPSIQRLDVKVTSSATSR